jgi:hypothetical protein
MEVGFGEIFYDSFYSHFSQLLSVFQSSPWELLYLHFSGIKLEDLHKFQGWRYSFILRPQNNLTDGFLAFKC